MNERFFELSDERRQTILNGAMHAFARHGYRKTSTEDIAREAGVSKPLIFHYFGSKRELYLFLYGYARDTMYAGLAPLLDPETTDFFEIVRNAQDAKMRLLALHPDLMTFVTQCYLEEDPEVSSELGDDIARLIAESSARFLGRVDGSKFRDSITVEQALNIVLWMAEGFMRLQPPEALEDMARLNDIYLAYLDVLKANFYRPEFLSQGASDSQAARSSQVAGSPEVAPPLANLDVEEVCA